MQISIIFFKILYEEELEGALILMQESSDPGKFYESGPSWEVFYRSGSGSNWKIFYGSGSKIGFSKLKYLEISSARSLKDCIISNA